MGSPLAPLPLPPTVHGNCFRLVERTLREWPLLQRAVRSWVAWEGTPSESADPTSAQMPQVRLTPQPSPEERVTVRGLHRPLPIKVSIYLAGTRVDDAMAIWAQICGGARDPESNAPLPSALYPADGSFMAALKAAGGSGFEAVQPGFAEVDSPRPDGVAMIAEGTIRLSIYVRAES